ncbi:MAG: glycerophosphodiester phosphodiesterase [Zetaproteobacteria bacterium]|nr:glycerophosphodiester phosphodiesterase [Zetaproteobacteria bacterium]
MKCKKCVMFLKFISFFLPSWTSAAKSTQVIAHRGAAGYIVEHTAPALAMAAAMGADFIEPDVVVSKDGVLMVFHDIVLDHTCDVAKKFLHRKRNDGKYYVMDFTYAELKSLRVHERFAHTEMKKRFPQDAAQFEMLSLEEWLGIVKGLEVSVQRPLGKIFELKEPKFHRQHGYDMLALFADFLRKHNLNHVSPQIYVECFEPTALVELAQVHGVVANLVQLMSLASEWHQPGQSSPADYTWMQTDEGLRSVKSYAMAIAPSLAMLYEHKEVGTIISRELSSRARKHGLKVFPYTVRKDALPQGFQDLEQIHRFLVVDEKVDGFFTDFPDLAVAYLARLK